MSLTAFTQSKTIVRVGKWNLTKKKLKRYWNICIYIEYVWEPMQLLSSRYSVVIDIFA